MSSGSKSNEKSLISIYCIKLELSRNYLVAIVRLGQNTG